MISPKHLFDSWDYFKRGKGRRKDIQHFERHLEDQIFALHHDLKTSQYEHGPYHQFYVFDPKKRHISGACVRDRLVHQTLHSALSNIFDEKFIFHSLSSRHEKGMHLGISHLHRMIQKVSANGRGTCFALKMDIRRFFDTIDHWTLKKLISKNLKDEKVLALIDIIINSFKTAQDFLSPRGIPLGNITSQLFANIYLHELDIFIKHHLRQKYYLRYCDDFILLSDDEQYLRDLIPVIEQFLKVHLRLELHPQKIILRKLSQGIDFVGHVLFQKYQLIRTTTKQRMQRRLREAYASYLEEKITPEAMDQKLHSYLGLLSHANQHTLSQALQNAYGTRHHFDEL